jgi:sterol desaturase/sphingolipid hydroxylase (fatty acid hydroxylase superfamily)
METIVSPSLEIGVRIGSYAGVFVVLAGWEWVRPRRRMRQGRWWRWPNNLGVLVVDIVAVRLLVPVAATGVAVIGAARGWGLFPAIGIPVWAAGLLGFLFLDFVIYAQHFVFHHVPLLWRLHRMHHADVEIDVTTGVRFHPLEILISLAIKIAVVLSLGIPALAVLAFEVTLNATAMFNHTNVSLPRRLEPVARWLVVTPQMHEVHHSIVRAETDSNFGFNLPWWDRLFGTYRSAPAASEKTLVLGIPMFRDATEQRLDRLLAQPFRGKSGR